jgi:hypothetical protein
MASTTMINVTATDNELYLIASTPAGSAEIGHIVSGYNNPVSYKVVPHSVLPPGNYSLTMVGINWGGPAAFDVVLTPAQAGTSYSSASAPVGVVWTKTVPMTV